MTTSTTGRIAPGGSVTGKVESTFDQDWFAADLTAGRTYDINLRGTDTSGGTLTDPNLMGLYDKDGSHISGTSSNDGGVNLDSRLFFTATYTGRYYVSAAGGGHEVVGVGTYTLELADLTASDADSMRSGATDLGDVTALSAEGSRQESIGNTDRADYYRFTLTDTRRVVLELRDLEQDADLSLEDDGGAALAGSREEGSNYEEVTRTLLAGTYYVRIEAKASGASDYTLGYEVRPATPPAPSGLGASPTHEQVTLIWLVSADESVTGYRVFRGADANSLTQLAAVTGRTTTQYFDAGVEPETNYLYAVRAVNTYGQSEPSLSLAVATEAAPPAVADPVVAEQGALQSVSEDIGVDFAADATTSGSVAVGGTVIGAIIGRDDRDWFAVSLVGGERYEIRCWQGPFRPDSPPLNVSPAVYAIYDDKGTKLYTGFKRNCELSPVLFIPDTDGIYYLEMGVHYYTNYRERDSLVYEMSIRTVPDNCRGTYDTDCDIDAASNFSEFPHPGRPGYPGKAKV